MEWRLSPEQKLWLEELLGQIRTKLDAEIARSGGEMLTGWENGQFCRSKDVYDWTNGFWPGQLWQMYHATGDERYRDAARAAGDKQAKAIDGFSGLNHDTGFMFLHTAVADYRLTGDVAARRRGLHATSILASRFNMAGKFIRAWDGYSPNPSLDTTGWMIVDCLMNLPLLCWASEQTEDPRFMFIAKAHADTALCAIVREDGSCNHIACLDPYTGEVLELPRGQGFASGSSWSRGQAWAVYGYALMAQKTGEARYKDAAKRIAHYFISNVALTGWVPLCDFRAPEEPVLWDTSAGLCAACGLLLLAEMAETYEKALYQQSAWNILYETVKKHGNFDPERDGMVDNFLANYHGEDIAGQKPCIYADYFLVEAVLRLLGKVFMIW